MRLFLLLMIASLASCSVVPYGPKSDSNSKGYWSKKLAKDVYRVYASYNRSSSPKRAEGYILIRGFELCHKAKKEFLKLGQIEKLAGAQKSTLSGLVYCYKSNKRIDLAGILNNESTVVGAIRDDKNSRLQADDTILQIDKKSVKTQTDIDMYFYKLKSTKRKLRLKIKRGNKTFTVREKAIVLEDTLSIKDVKEVANTWNVPFANISGIE